MTTSPNKHGLAVAVALGADTQGLAIARSLRPLGIPVVIASPDRFDRFTFTLHAKWRKLDHLSGERMIEPLLALGTALQKETGIKPVLIPTRDDSTLDLIDHADAISSQFNWACNDPALLRSLLTKEGVANAAISLGEEVPRTLAINSEADIEKIRDLTPPFAVKPGWRNDAYMSRYIKAHQVATHDEAMALSCDILTLIPSLVVQEWAPGDDDSIWFCLQYHGHDGEVWASFVGRKFHTWPAGTGDLVSGHPAPDDFGLTERTTSFFRRVGLRGWCALEFKQHAETGKFLMIEPTVGRMDTFSELAVVNGVNLPLAGYSDLAGLPRPTPGVHPTATAWRKDWLINRKAARFKGKGALHGPEGMPIVDGIWRSSDPLPGLTAYPWRLLTGGSRAVLRKLGCWQ